MLVGGLLVDRMPVDIFPDLTAPTVTVIAEARGMGPEEIELLVTFPLESALNGAPSVRRLRSFSAAGIVVIRVDFEWGADIYRARQVVTERLQTVALPAGVARPELGPIGIGDGVRSPSWPSPPRASIRWRFAGWRRPWCAAASSRCRGSPRWWSSGGIGASTASRPTPRRLAQTGISVDSLVEALEAASGVPAAGFHVDRGQEYLVRGRGRAQSVDDLANVVLRVENGPAPARGAGGPGTRGSRAEAGNRRYAEKSGRSLEGFAYYLVFGTFKMAVVLQQIFLRYHRGQTKDERFAGMGDAAAQLFGLAADRRP